MTIQAAYCPVSLTPLLDQTARPIRGGMIYAFDAGTTNARTVYLDAGLTTPLPSPVKTDAFGRVPVIWVGLGSYKIELHDAANALIATVDNLPGGTQFFDTPATPSGFVTGDMKFAHGTGVQNGWVIANTNTIGNQNSAATARASADTQGLFVWLWNQDQTLAVSGGRGATATLDYAAGKTIATPDYRGKSATGCDQMGAGLTAGVITAATTATPDQVGTKFGTETVTLTLAQIPTFTPTVTILAAGGHSHTGTTDLQGSHTHTLNDPAHAHAYNQANSVGVGSGGGPGFSNNFSNTTTNSQTGITINTAGAHTHNVTTNAVPDHTHTATAASVGGGGTHPNMQPSILGYWHIRL